MSVVDNPPLDRQDVLVLIADGADGAFPLDPIRLMKGCFLVSQRGKHAWRSLFDFRPYDYGPFDSDVYRSRDGLLSRGLLSADHRGRYATYRLTPAGRSRAAELRRAIGGSDADWLRQIGKYVTSRSFTELLDEIYAAFPEYATESRYRRS